MKTIMFFLFFLIIFSSTINGQNKTINWITFEQLEDSLAIKPKKILISFYADWCVYCKKMDKVAYQNNKVISVLNSEYYAVKMNAESSEIINFDNKKYYNKQIGKSRKPTHEIPLLLTSRKNKPFTLPATIILNKNFKIQKRYFEYLSSDKMISILK